MLLMRLIGIVSILLGSVQLFAARSAYRGVRVAGNAATSPFMLLSLWFGLLFGVGLLGFGVAALVGVF